MSCKAAHFSRLEERHIDNCLPACTRPPRMAAVQSCLLYHGCKQLCVLLLMCSPGFKSLNPPCNTAAPWSTPQQPPGVPHILPTHRVKNQTHPLSSLNSWALCALHAFPYCCVMSVTYHSCLPPLSLSLGQSPHFLIFLGALCDSMPPMSFGLYNAYIISIISCLLSSSRGVVSIANCNFLRQY